MTILSDDQLARCREAVKLNLAFEGTAVITDLLDTVDNYKVHLLEAGTIVAELGESNRALHEENASLLKELELSGE